MMLAGGAEGIGTNVETGEAETIAVAKEGTQTAEMDEQVGVTKLVGCSTAGGEKDGVDGGVATSVGSAAVNMMDDGSSAENRA